MLLCLSLLFFVAAILMAHRHSLVSLPLLALGTIAGIWGARRPKAQPSVRQD
jgi:hypothetical protein